MYMLLESIIPSGEPRALLQKLSSNSPDMVISYLPSSPNLFMFPSKDGDLPVVILYVREDHELPHGYVLSSYGRSGKLPIGEPIPFLPSRPIPAALLMTNLKFANYEKFIHFGIKAADNNITVLTHIIAIVRYSAYPTAEELKREFEVTPYAHRPIITPSVFLNYHIDLSSCPITALDAVVIYDKNSVERYVFSKKRAKFNVVLIIKGNQKPPPGHYLGKPGATKLKNQRYPYKVKVPIAGYLLAENNPMQMKDEDEMFPGRHFQIWSEDKMAFKEESIVNIVFVDEDKASDVSGSPATPPTLSKFT